MKWNIEHFGIQGPIKLGAKLQDIKLLIGEHDDYFKRVEGADETIYTYDKMGLHLAITKSMRLEILTIFLPNEVYLGETQLLNQSIHFVEKILQKNNFVFENEEAGIYLSELNVFFVFVDDVLDGIELYNK